MKSLINFIKTNPFIQKNYQLWINMYIVINTIGITIWQLYPLLKTNSAGFVEISFAVHNVVFIAIVMLRREHRAVDVNIKHQLIALIAFFSGITFIGAESTTDNTTLIVSMAVILVANVLGIITLINLGKSFGILIAFRELKTTGLYSFVRHPMYATDILLRVGFIVSHPTVYVIIMTILSILCYGYRAVLEERFIGTQTDYKSFKQKTKYRLIPFVW